MTAQQMAEKMTAHLKTMTRRSLLPSKDGEAFSCAYRGGNDGKEMCLFGCLIPDEVYSETFEYNNLYALRTKAGVEEHVIPDEILTMVTGEYKEECISQWIGLSGFIQGAHDGCCTYAGGNFPTAVAQLALEEITIWKDNPERLQDVITIADVFIEAFTKLIEES